MSKCRVVLEIHGDKVRMVRDADGEDGHFDIEVLGSAIAAAIRALNPPRIETVVAHIINSLAAGADWNNLDIDSKHNALVDDFSTAGSKVLDWWEAFDNRMLRATLVEPKQ